MGIVSCTVSRHDLRVIQGGIKQLALMGCGAFHLYLTQSLVPSLTGSSLDIIDGLVADFQTQVFLRILDATQGNGYGGIDHWSADIHAGIELLGATVGDGYLHISIIQLQGEVHLVRLFATEATGIFSPSRQQMPFGTIIQLTTQKAAFHNRYDMLWDAVTHVQQQRLVLLVRIGQTVGHRMVCGSQFGKDVIAVEPDLIVIRSSHLFRLL